VNDGEIIHVKMQADFYSGVEEQAQQTRQLADQ